MMLSRINIKFQTRFRHAINVDFYNNIKHVSLIY